jgi:hypothetical protein
MLGIPCSREYLSGLGLQMVGLFFLTLHYSIGAFPFWCELPFSWIFGHQAHFPEDPVPDLELPGVYCLVEVPSRSILIGCPSHLGIISFCRQKIQVQVDTFIIEPQVVVCYPEARGSYFCRDDRLGPISEGEEGVTSRCSNYRTI